MSLLTERIINNAILPLNSKERANVLIIDDSLFERNRSKKVELLAKVYDHAKHKYRFGFRMLTFGWSDVSTFLPVNSILLSTENKKNRINEAAEVDKRTVGYKRRQLAMEKGTQAMLTLLDTAKKVAIPAKVVYVRNRNKRKEYLCLISTDINLDKNEIIRIYGKRWKAGNQMITGLLGNSFYIFLMKCLISHGSRLFKCYSKCSEPCLQKTPSYQKRKSLNWWMYL